MNLFLLRSLIPGIVYWICSVITIFIDFNLEQYEENFNFNLIRLWMERYEPLSFLNQQKPLSSYPPFRVPFPKVTIISRHNRVGSCLGNTYKTGPCLWHWCETQTDYDAYCCYRKPCGYLVLLKVSCLLMSWCYHSHKCFLISSGNFQARILFNGLRNSAKQSFHLLKNCKQIAVLRRQYAEDKTSFD